MSDGKTYFYETEVEWTGAKDLKLSGAKQPAMPQERRRSARVGRITGARAFRRNEVFSF